MGTHMYYTLGQARILLGGIDWKTLHTWLREAAITPETDPKDSRKKRLSRKQVHRLASMHGITLSDADTSLPVHGGVPQPHSSLTTEVAQLQKNLEALTACFDDRFEQATHQLDTSLQEGLQEVKKEMLSFIREVFRELLSSGVGIVGTPPLTGEEQTGRSIFLSGELPTPPFVPSEQENTHAPK